MKTTDQIDQLATALSAAQLSMPKVAKSARNPHFKNTYATLDGVLEAIREPLANNGLALVQAGAFEEGRVVVVTRLVHKSGQWIESSLALRPEKDTPQGIGSALSYGKRYQAVSMLAIATGEDDDGEEDRKAEEARLEAEKQKKKIFNKESQSDVEGIQQILTGWKIPQDQHPFIIEKMHHRLKTDLHSVVKDLMG